MKNELRANIKMLERTENLARRILQGKRPRWWERILLWTGYYKMGEQGKGYPYYGERFGKDVSEK